MTAEEQKRADLAQVCVYSRVSAADVVWLCLFMQEAIRQGEARLAALKREEELARARQAELLKVMPIHGSRFHL